MNRPNRVDYMKFIIYDTFEEPHDKIFHKDAYLKDLEKYCNALESRLEYYKSLTGMHLKDSISVKAEDGSAKRWWKD